MINGFLRAVIAAAILPLPRSCGPALILLLGWTFRDQVEILASSLERFGAWMVILIATLFAFYLPKKYRDRQRIYRELRVRRITAQELKTKMENGERPIVVDLRERAEQGEGIIPTAIMLADLTAERVLAESQPEIVMYCSCPDEFTSAREALRLKRLGLTHVHPLEGGFPRWHALGFPVEQAGTGAHAMIARPKVLKPVQGRQRAVDLTSSIAV
jgi:rhodanese-related sulfurtransferase